MVWMFRERRGGNGTIRPMRCSLHPDRIATRACDLCRRYHCDDCLEVTGGECFCPDCLPAAGTAPRPMERKATRWPRRAGVVATVALAGALVAAALVGRDESGGEIPVPITRDRSRMADSFLALERAAIAVETFCAEQGRAPRGWSDLVPEVVGEVPVDPCSPDGAPLRLTAPSWDEDSVVLYSVGPDARDDGGKAFSTETGLGDLVYFVR